MTFLPASLANFCVDLHQLRVFIDGGHMREQSLMPTTLLDWPRVAELLPEQKLVYGLGFWAGRYTNSIGIAATPLRPLAASLGLDPTALDTGIKTLCDVQLLIADWERYEFFVRDWFRFHKFKGVGIVIAKHEFAKLASEILRNAVLEAASWLVEPPALMKNQTLTLPTATSASKSISATAEKIRIRRPSGIVTYTDSDPDRAQEIEENYPSDLIKTAIEVVERRRKEPVPGLVMREIERALKVMNQARLISGDSKENNPQAVTYSIKDKDMKSLWNAIGMKGPKVKS